MQEKRKKELLHEIIKADRTADNKYKDETTRAEAREKARKLKKELWSIKEEEDRVRQEIKRLDIKESNTTISYEMVWQNENMTESIERQLTRIFDINLLTKLVYLAQYINRIDIAAIILRRTDQLQTRQKERTYRL